MKKLIYIVFTLSLYFCLSGCSGYKPIFASSNLDFKISDYSIEGNKVLGNKIYIKLNKLTTSNKKNNSNIKVVDILINASKDKNATSKDSSGKILEYRITLNTKIIVTDTIDESKILDQTFTSSISYRAQDQYSETVKLENKSLEDIINKTYQEILIKLSQNLS